MEEQGTRPSGSAGYGDRIGAVRVGAAERFADRADHRRSNLAHIREGRLVDTPERLAKRADRLRRYLAGTSPAAAAVPPQAGGVLLEAMINGSQLLDIRWLERGVAAARAVGRIDVCGDGGQHLAYGTGSLVSPRLLLTNHHVLPSAEVAASSRVELDLQDGPDGQPMNARTFDLDPDQFYLSDEELDFAFVAVAGDADELGRYGFNRLVEATGKAVVGEYATIVQHPNGHKKQVSLRENKIVDLLDSFIHYEADTAPGSSGSPVFNDQWEVVGVHHASVPAPDDGELAAHMNEAVRVSVLLERARASVPRGRKSRFRRLLLPETVAEAATARSPARSLHPVAPALVAGSLPAVSIDAGRRGPHDVLLTIPIEVTVRIPGAGMAS